MYVIIYKDLDAAACQYDNSEINVSGLIEKMEDFPEWLENHNQNRRDNSTIEDADGNDVLDEYFVDETEDDFQFCPVNLFKP